MCRAFLYFSEVVLSPVYNLFEIGNRIVYVTVFLFKFQFIQNFPKFSLLIVGKSGSSIIAYKTLSKVVILKAK